VEQDRDGHDDGQHWIHPVGQGAAHGGGQARARLQRRRGDELEEQLHLPQLDLAARRFHQRHGPVVAPSVRAAALQLLEGVDVGAVGETAVHRVGEVEDVAPVLDREELPRLGQALDRDGEGVLGRLPDRDVLAAAEQALVDEVIAQRHADAEAAHARHSGAAAGASAAASGS
jgi:hypothetical protein